jgi:dolichyl-phosphate-mannose-protein mannosyltransferase
MSTAAATRNTSAPIHAPWPNMASARGAGAGSRSGAALEAVGTSAASAKASITLRNIGTSGAGTWQARPIGATGEPRFPWRARALIPGPAMQSAPEPPPRHPADPIGWTVGLTALFAALAWVRLGIPSKPMFDEVHYLPAARAILAGARPLNLEHPPLGKELLALGMAVFGDGPLGWRIMPWLFGVAGLFAGMRALWFASGSRFASMAYGALLVTGFPLLVESRIAMLDVFMVGLVLVALWQFAAALRENETARRRLPVAGAALGLAMAAKWNAVPMAVLPGLAFAGLRLRQAGWRALVVHRAPPIAWVSLAEAALWLGVLPLLAYAAAFWPLWLLPHDPSGPAGLIGLHREMLQLQHQQLPAHPYQSVWWQWVIDWRAIWYLYEPVDGAQRGVMLIGNPLTMWLGLPALAWCGWMGATRGRYDAVAVAVLYLASLGLWLVAGKNVQFYYHYFLPSCFLLAALALALAELWQRGWRWPPLLALAGAIALFAYFYPILTAAVLPSDRGFERWTWIDSWR